MNPPFSATPGVDRITRDADLRHIRSAASMLPPGGRLVTITSAHCAPGDTAGRLDPPARCVFTMAIAGRAYARRGTAFDTRLTVLERGAGPDVKLDGTARAENAAELLDAIIAQVPQRRPITPIPAPAGPARDLFGKTLAPKTAKRDPKPASTPETRQAHDWGPVSELTIGTGPVDVPAHSPVNDAGPYAPWRPDAVRVAGAIEQAKSRKDRKRPARCCLDKAGFPAAMPEGRKLSHGNAGLYPLRQLDRRRCPPAIPKLDHYLHDLLFFMDCPAI